MPASSANLGPGFDCMAAALAPRLELEVAEADASRSTPIWTSPPGRRNLGGAGLRARCTPPTGSHSRCARRSRSRVDSGHRQQRRRGPRRRERRRRPDADVLALATEIEEHRRQRRGGAGRRFCDLQRRAVRAHRGARRPVGLRRRAPRSARHANGPRALSERVPLADAVFNAAHAALLALALERGDLELLARALADRLHEAPRAALYPAFGRPGRHARGEFGALAATISGAGPDGSASGSLPTPPRRLWSGWPARRGLGAGPAHAVLARRAQVSEL